MEMGTGESGNDKVVDRVSLLTGSRKPHFACMVTQ
jgi:hypothetical protein